jgi:hypothetical protein
MRKWLMWLALACFVTGCAGVEGGSMSMKSKQEDKSTWQIDVTPNDCYEENAVPVPAVRPGKAVK